ncbi:MAG: hypothetical protein ACRDHW_00825 [Ktedonobacteraceae bacterium]
MSYSPRYIGDTRAFHNTFTPDTGTFPVTGATLLMNFVDTSNGNHTVGTGTWSNITSDAADYAPANTDVVQTTPGIYKWYPTVNGIPMDPLIIEIKDPTKLQP